MVKLQALSVVAISAVILSTSETATATTFNPSPLFTDVTSYTTSGVTDIYFPNPSDLKTGNYSFLIALLLQGANADRNVTVVSERVPESARSYWAFWNRYCWNYD